MPIDMYLINYIYMYSCTTHSVFSLVHFFSLRNVQLFQNIICVKHISTEFNCTISSHIFFFIEQFSGQQRFTTLCRWHCCCGMFSYLISKIKKNEIKCMMFYSEKSKFKGITEEWFPIYLYYNFHRNFESEQMQCGCEL